MALLVFSSAYAVARIHMPLAAGKGKAVKAVSATVEVPSAPAGKTPTQLASPAERPMATAGRAQSAKQSKPSQPSWSWLTLTAGEPAAPPQAGAGGDGPPANPGLANARAMVSSLEGTPIYFGGLSEAEFRDKEIRCLATAIYYEARSEPIEGQLAVAQVIMNRIRSEHYPATVCGVVYEGAERGTGCQFSFTRGGAVTARKDAGRWLQAMELARRVADGGVWLKSVGHATHYHADYVSPVWTRDMNRIQQVGRHIFYRPKSFRAPFARTAAQ